MKRATAIWLVILLMFSCKSPDYLWKEKAENPDFIHRSIKVITDVMVQDIYSPPVASRTYAYVSVAAYEAARQGDSSCISLSGQLNGLADFPKPAANKSYCYSLASVQAILKVGRVLVASEKKLDDFNLIISKEFKQTGMPSDVFENSVDFGNQIAQHVIDWMEKDNYKKVKALSKFSGSDNESSWKPTPPAYMSAVEPSWNQLRPFLMDSAQQFKPAVALAFSKKPGDQFYREVEDVYQAGMHLDSSQIDIAMFWDCNPFKMNLNGHVMYATKKISPGGHWMNIARLACKKANTDYIRSTEVYARLAVVNADAFISCWDEKFRSNVIRPETFINQYIDQHWMPLLQTPPFPEYTSGHSVISTASAVLLTQMFGARFSYSDSTEVEFGLPVRHFDSFKQAADEASLSRFYGGIHYMFSINEGIRQGEHIGNFFTNGLITRRSLSSKKK